VDRVNARRQIATAQRLAKPSKYHNQKITLDGERFDSKKEARIWSELLLRQERPARIVAPFNGKWQFPLNCPVRFESICGFAELPSIWLTSFGSIAKAERHVADCKGGRGTMTQMARLNNSNGSYSKMEFQ